MLTVNAEAFLRNDLDATFVAQVVLIMTPIFEVVHQAPSHKDRGYDLLDGIIHSGNLTAVQMKSELHQLEHTLTRLNTVVVSEWPAANKDGTVDGSPFQGLRWSSEPLMAAYMSACNNSDSVVGVIPTDDDLWHGDFTTEQLLIIADSIDFNCQAYDSTTI